ncbi:cupin domain-containing protein [Enterobacteriaceae bacterium H4N4]|uniref:Cupin domain-containing protein n=1 Tax=Silvania confinis TaxID=2926470 RepID=A0A9J6QGZ9_9ENTR|nr:cupin domain-containing protein [Silvania confinis]MCU6670052.1 cupin domain-containing protein [Silvania confinis]
MGLNLFSNLPDNGLRSEAEIFDVLLSAPGIIIERILSTGQASPPGFWYCQSQSEWVVVIRGSAGVKFEQDDTVRVLRAGDSLHIPAQCRHRVEWTDPQEPTLWLAVHYTP